MLWALCRYTRHGQLFATYTVPGSEVEYWTLRYNLTRYQPLFGNWVGLWNTQLGYGEALGHTTALPPFKQFHSGGPKSTRGFRWKIIYKKNFSNKTDAMSYEYKLKHDRKKRDFIYNKSL